MLRLTTAALGCLGVLAVGCDDPPSAPQAAPSASSSAASAPSAKEPFTEAVPGDSKGKKKKLAFAWPAGLRARVQTLRDQDQNGQKGRVNAYWDMAVNAADSQRLTVLVENFEVEDAATEQKQIARSTSALGSLVPDLLVSTQGKLVGVENPERSIGKMRELFLQMMPGLDPSQANQLLGQVLNPQTLEVKATSEWAALVDNWRGVEAELGEELQSNEMAPLGIGGIPEIEFETTYTVHGMIPCTVGASDRKCVRIEGESSPPKDQLELFANLLFKKLSGAAQMPSPMGMDDVSLRTTFTLVTEADTLVPHYLRFERRMTATVGTPRGGLPMREVDKQERWFRYTQD